MEYVPTDPIQIAIYAGLFVLSQWLQTKGVRVPGIGPSPSPVAPVPTLPQSPVLDLLRRLREELGPLLPLLKQAADEGKEPKKD